MIVIVVWARNILWTILISLTKWLHINVEISCFLSIKLVSKFSGPVLRYEQVENAVSEICVGCFTGFTTEGSLV